MGHIRLGIPPATRQWGQVVELLAADRHAIEDIALAVEEAADRSLSTAVNDHGFIEALWLLLSIPQALAAEDDISALHAIGIHLEAGAGLTDLAAGMEAALEGFRRRSPVPTSDLALMSRDAAIATLVGLALDRAPSLWAASIDDERATIASFASTTNFGELAQRFFTNVLHGHLRYFLDREVSRHIRPGSALSSVADADYFDEAVRRHCRETTLIMRAFAREWLGKNRFYLDKDISRRDAAAFAAHAFTKIRAELHNRSSRVAA